MLIFTTVRAVLEAPMVSGGPQATALAQAWLEISVFPGLATLLLQLPPASGSALWAPPRVLVTLDDLPSPAPRVGGACAEPLTDRTRKGGVTPGTESCLPGAVLLTFSLAGWEEPVVRGEGPWTGPHSWTYGWSAGPRLCLDSTGQTRELTGTRRPEPLTSCRDGKWPVPAAELSPAHRHGTTWTRRHVDTGPRGTLHTLSLRED